MAALETLMANRERMAKLREDIAALEKERYALERSEWELKSAAAKELPPMEVKFTFTPWENAHRDWDDPALVNWLLHGTPAPTEAHKVVTSFPIEAGGYGYVYNTATGRLSNGQGGGRIWVDATNRFGVTKPEAKAAALEFFAILEQFVKDNPKGGDVTEVTKAAFLKYQAAR